MNPILLLYYASWGALQNGSKLSDIDGSKLTHLCYAYGKPNSIYDFELWEYNADLTFKITAVPTESDFMMSTDVELQPLKAFKKKYSHLKLGILLKNDKDEHFQEMISNIKRQQRLVNSMCTFMKANGFDFVDIDVGNLPKKDHHNITKFVELASQQVKEKVSKEAFVTLVLPGEVKHLDNFDLKAISKSVKFANLMAFGYYSEGKEVSVHNSPYFAPKDQDSVDRAIRHCKENGLEGSQLVLGFSGLYPIYGNCTTIGRPYSNDARVSGEHNPHLWYYNEIIKHADQLESHFDKDTGAAWSIVKDKNALISHESAESVDFKLDKAIEKQNLLGASFIYHYHDSLHKDSLIDKIQQKLKKISDKRTIVQKGSEKQNEANKPGQEKEAQKENKETHATKKEEEKKDKPANDQQKNSKLEPPVIAKDEKDQKSEKKPAAAVNVQKAETEKNNLPAPKSSNNAKQEKLAENPKIASSPASEAKQAVEERNKEAMKPQHQTAKPENPQADEKQKTPSPAEKKEPAKK